MGYRDAPASLGNGIRAACTGKQQAAAAQPPSVPTPPPPPPHAASSSSAAALAARDQLLVAGATPESSLLALLVRESKNIETRRGTNNECNVGVGERASERRLGYLFPFFANLFSLSPSALSLFLSPFLST